MLRLGIASEILYMTENLALPVPFAEKRTATSILRQADSITPLPIINS